VESDQEVSMATELEPRVERRLVSRARRDPDAFRELYHAYFPRVYAYIGYRVGPVQDVEDLTAETFLRAVEHLASFRWRGEGSFAAWLFRIAHNLVANFYRTAERAPEPISIELLPNVVAGDALPADYLGRKEVLANLRQLMTLLSPRQQEIITLRFFGGLRNQEIADLLELDERTVAAHLCRGIRRLQESFDAATAHDVRREVAQLEVSRG
jgi:RNA polymerase sigma-70 factor, ECF subfamily